MRLKHRKLGVVFSTGGLLKREWYLVFCLWWWAISLTASGITVEHLWKD